MKLIWPLFVFFSIHSMLLAQDDEQIIRNKLQDQTTCWNNGDLECFMQGYWHSDSLVFVGSKGPKYGWQTTLDSYRASYPDKAAMGKLEFDLLSFQRIASDAYFVIGKWKLIRAKDGLEGHFTLLWRKISGEWVIVADHSS